MARALMDEDDSEEDEKTDSVGAVGSPKGDSTGTDPESTRVEQTPMETGH